MKVARNELCPCGSGLKYKKCHFGKPLPTDEVVVAETTAARRDRRQAIGLVALGLVVAITAGALNSVYTGLVVAAAWALALVAYLSFRNPPPPHEEPGEGAELNFGRTRNDD